MNYKNIKFNTMPSMLPILGGKVGREAVLLKPLEVSWVSREDDGPWGDPQKITIPTHFSSDGPSTPSRLRGLVPYTHRQLRAAIVHDWIVECLLITNHRLKVFGRDAFRDPPYLWTWAEASEFFQAMLEADGVPWLRRTIMGAAVTIHGWFR